MALKISVFTTSTNPLGRGDLYAEAIGSYKFADEIVVIEGGMSNHNGLPVVVKKHPWPKEFEWPFIGQQFQRGYEVCTGDWVIHADLDFIFHEQDYSAIRKAFEDNPNAPALSFWKYQFILPDRYNLKSRLVIAVNKGKYGDRIRFDSGGDLCQPSLDGKYISPNDVPEARVPFYNYEKILKTKEQLADDAGRMERAWQRYFGEYQMGSDGTDESALEKYIELAIGRFHKPQERVALAFHPEIMHNTIKALTPNQFGYSLFGYHKNDYMKGLA